MRVVVTGATSMIGIALINECIKNGCEVLAIIRKDTNHINRLPKSCLIKVKYADLNTLESVVDNENLYDVFYHFAWGYTSKLERDYPIKQENNIRTTLLAVKLANKLGCKKFIGAGTQAEYGQINGSIIDADTRANPITSYGIAKFSANMMSRRMCEQFGMKHIWARIFSVYGANDREGTMLDYAIKQFIKEKPAKFSAATQMWNYLHEEDAGKMFYLLGIKEVDAGIYCIANNESRVLRDYIEEMAEIFGKNTKCEFMSSNSAESMIELNVDISKTVKAIEYTPQITFSEGIYKMIETIKNSIIQ